MNSTQEQHEIEQWNVFEIALEGPASGNAFVDVHLTAIFTCGDSSYELEGFYDGQTVYRIRFMPDRPGRWSYITSSNCAELDCHSGTFECIPASKTNRGPVSVHQTYQFRYADGSAYFPIGTTSYGWAHQMESLARQTLSSLENSPFNKMRMCILPHYSEFSRNNSIAMPYMRNDDGSWDFTRFNVEYFRIVEQRVAALKALGIQADLILFHPYNSEWGFDAMDSSSDELYLRYVLARFGAFSHVWWSLANEYDLLEHKDLEFWNAMGSLVARLDPYKHLCSIHNWRRIYEHWRPWISHASIQDGLAVSADGMAVIMRNVYYKPVVYDEVCYEGNIDERWGELESEEFVHRFWQTLVGGTYISHGEIYVQPGASADEVWTGVGGRLYSQSLDRIAFAARIVEALPAMPVPADHTFNKNICSSNGDVFLYYWGRELREQWDFALPSDNLDIPENSEFRVDIIDTWNMTIEPVQHIFRVCRSGKCLYTDVLRRKVTLPRRRYMALRITRV